MKRDSRFLVISSALFALSVLCLLNQYFYEQAEEERLLRSKKPVEISLLSTL